MNCLVCNSSLEGKQLTAKFCSKQCSDKWNSGYFGGNGLRIQALERDNYTCQKCSSTEKLEVHHLDENPDHNVIENLITLCSVCHRRHHLSGSRNTKFKNITKEQIQHAVENTTSLDEAAFMLGITRKTLASKRKEFNLPTLSNARTGEQNKNYKHLTVNEIRLAFEVTGSWEDAAKRLGVSPSFLRRRRREMGVDSYKNRLAKEISKEAILEAIEKTSTLQEASNLLGITRKTLMKKREQFELK